MAGFSGKVSVSDHWAALPTGSGFVSVECVSGVLRNGASEFPLESGPVPLTRSCVQSAAYEAGGFHICRAQNQDQEAG